MNKQYIFIILIIVMLNMMYLVLSHKYEEYRDYQYMQNLTELNMTYIEKIKSAQDILENRSTRAYKNKILKSEGWRKNPWEKVVYLISEEKYNKYTKSWETVDDETPILQSLLDEKSLLATMTIYEKWVYLIFWKDIR